MSLDEKENLYKIICERGLLYPILVFYATFINISVFVIFPPIFAHTPALVRVQSHTCALTHPHMQTLPLTPTCARCMHIDERLTKAKTSCSNTLFPQFSCYPAIIIHLPNYNIKLNSPTFGQFCHQKVYYSFLLCLTAHF